MDKEPDKLGNIFDKHIEFEFDKEDVDATMTTMTEDPFGFYMSNFSQIHLTFFL